MRERNQYEQYGYDQYELPGVSKPSAAPRVVSRKKVAGILMKRFFRSPLMSTTAVILCAAAFAGIIIASYPDSGNGDKPVPVIKAEMKPIKVLPTDPGGMEVPYKDSTIFDSIREAEAKKEPAKVESLFGNQDGEQEVDSLREMAKASQQPAEMPAEDDAAVAAAPAPSLDITEKVATAEGADQPETVDVQTKDVAASDEGTASDAPQEVAEAPAVPEEPLNLPRIHKMGVSEDDSSDAQADDGLKEEAKSAKAEAEHKPGASPDTLAFVRSVLDKKDGVKREAEPEDQAEAEMPAAKVAKVEAITPEPEAPVAKPEPVKVEPAKVEPAAGNASAPVEIASKGGSHYVQLGSVRSRDGAETEWKRIQGEFSSALAGSGHRVSEADLGERGMYYRIQAGPFSEAQAKSICESIKAQKPGACLVTK